MQNLAAHADLKGSLLPSLKITAPNGAKIIIKIKKLCFKGFLLALEGGRVKPRPLIDELMKRYCEHYFTATSSIK